jgi:hypothetical protein
MYIFRERPRIGAVNVVFKNFGAKICKLGILFFSRFPYYVICGSTFGAIIVN